MNGATRWSEASRPQRCQPQCESVNTIQPRYTNRNGQAVREAEASIDREDMSHAAIEFLGVKGGGGRRKITSEPGRPGSTKPRDRRRGACNMPRESITVAWSSRESEGFVVALKPGNAGGAKGPCRRHAVRQNKEIRLGHPATEDAPTLKLTLKISELRWQIGLTAKQASQRRRCSKPTALSNDAYLRANGLSAIGATRVGCLRMPECEESPGKAGCGKSARPV